MCKLLIAVVVTLALGGVLTACGYRTPLTLPKPDTKPPVTTPAERNPK